MKNGGVSYEHPSAQSGSRKRPRSWSYIFSGNPATTYSGTSHYIGYTALNNGGEYQIITHINTLPSLPAGSVVTNAAINVRHSTFSNDSSANYIMMEAHRLTIDKSSGQTYDTPMILTAPLISST